MVNSLYLSLVLQKAEVDLKAMVHQMHLTASRQKAEQERSGKGHRKTACSVLVTYCRSYTERSCFQTVFLLCSESTKAAILLAMAC